MNRVGHKREYFNPKLVLHKIVYNICFIPKLNISVTSIKKKLQRYLNIHFLPSQKPPLQNLDGRPSKITLDVPFYSCVLN